MGQWRLSREDSSEGENTEYGAVVKEGLLLRSGGRGPPPMCDTSFLQGSRECAALLGEERKQIAGEGGHADG